MKSKHHIVMLFIVIVTTFNTNNYSFINGSPFTVVNTCLSKVWGMFVLHSIQLLTYLLSVG